MAENETERTPDSPVEFYERRDTVIGQPQSAPREPHDGATLVHEVVVHTDKHILDPNSELAVQVPKGVGASSVENAVGLAESLRAGTAEQQFARAAEEAGEGGDFPKASDSTGSQFTDPAEREKAEEQPEADGEPKS